MRIWFIREISTGNYIPIAEGRNGRGGSHLEPSKNRGDARIFRTRLSAARFLGAWLKGKYVTDRGYNPGHPGNDWEQDYYEDTTIVPVPTRIREDMEIIEVEIVLP